MSGRAVYDPCLNEILERAARAYRQRDDAVFASLLENAARRAPYRPDVRFCLASHYIQNNSPERALDVYEELARFVPGDVHALVCLAHWRRHGGDAAAAGEALERLRMVRPAVADDLRRVWDCIDSWLSRPVADGLPGMPGGGGPVAVLTLGHKLSPYGNPRRELVDRLEKTLEAARLYPDAEIVVSGGVPQSERVEAVEMRRWLTDRGVAAERIHEEGYARDGVENLLYSRTILDARGIAMVVAITSAANIRRTGAGLEILAWTCGSSWTVRATAASGKTFKSFRDDGRDLLKIYRDALRSYGIPMMASYPALVER